MGKKDKKKKGLGKAKTEAKAAKKADKANKKARASDDDVSRTIPFQLTLFPFPLSSFHTLHFAL